MGEGNAHRLGGLLAAVVAASLIALSGLFGVLATIAKVGPETGSATGSVADIPTRYLLAYRASADRFELGPRGWAYLAGIGKVETDHGRLAAPGVRSGQNSHGCCAGPMQIHNGFGAGTATWARYRVDGDSDGRADIYDPEDAIFTAAHLERRSGAPRDWRRAIFAYNHASWYVDQVVAQAKRYLEAAQESAASPGRGVGSSEPLGGAWLAAVPSFPGERCDRRIVGDVEALTKRFGLILTDCFGGAPHAIDGEHPLGVAADLVPVDGNWERTRRLAVGAGWSPSCAASGCPGRGPFRVVLYNGFPAHGDPRHTRTPHLHVSWQHAPASPFTAPRWVRVLSSSRGRGR